GRHRVPVTGEGLFSWARRATKNPRRRGAVEGRRAGRGTWSACAPTKYYEDGGGALHVPTFADVRPSVKSVDYLSQISRRIPPPGRGQPGSGRGTPPDGACPPRFVRTSDSTRPAAIGRATRKPWPLGQPISRSASSCSGRSMPSATTVSPRSLPSRTIVRVSSVSVSSDPRPATNDG